MKIGILRERKSIPDSRTPLNPVQAAFLRDQLDIDIVVEASPNRCFTNEEYVQLNVPVVTDLSDRDVLMGVKEVPVEHLQPGKVYFFFSHTMKKQPYNRALLQAILEKEIRLIDYELLTNMHGQRLIAFGHFAGMVGAHNALWTWGTRTGHFMLPRLKDLENYDVAKDQYLGMHWPNIKIVLTGTGRVGTGALLTLQDMGIRQVEPATFLQSSFSEAVFTQLLPHHYAADKSGDPFDKSLFYNNPSAFKSIFFPFAAVSDIMINGIYWLPGAPAFFSKEEMRHPDFRIQVISDITCDIAPVSSIPSSLRTASIDDPVFGYDPISEREVEPYQSGVVDMMTVSNLPNELPRESSKAFGKQFITAIMGELMKNEPSGMLERATVAEQGRLKPAFSYLQDWVDGKEDELVMVDHASS